MQQENNQSTRLEKTVPASDFIRALLSITSSITAEMHDIRITADGDVITAFIDDATITIAPRTAQEGGAA